MDRGLIIGRDDKATLRPGAYILALAVYLTGLVAMAPAHLLSVQLLHASGGRVRLVNAQGTVWEGAGQLVYRDGLGQAAFANGLAWRLMPEHLLQGKLSFGIKLDASARPFLLSVSTSRISFADADAEFAAPILALGIPGLSALQPRGNVLFRVGALSIQPGGWEGDIALQWRAAGLGAMPSAPPGDYELRVTSDGATVRASARTLRGPLLIDGAGSWPVRAPPELPLTVRVPLQHRQQLTPVLRMISVERSPGEFHLRLK